MSVIRVEKTNNYTVMSNYHLKDGRLSLKAKGLMSWMLSCPENWDYSIEGTANLKSVIKEGRDAIRGAFKELEDAGYLVRDSRHNKEGKFEVEYTLFEKPKEPSEPCRISRHGKTATDNPTQINTKEQNTKKEERKEEREKRRSYSEILSSLVRDANVRDALSQYIQMRVAKKAYPTNSALELLIKRLEELSKNPQEQVNIVEQAIRGGYMDFKPIRKEVKSSPKKPRAVLERFDPEKDHLAKGKDGNVLVY